ncbi:MAG TPA: SDR family oxidoreductase [Clostridiales bacterium]|nr:SDR family oxidoreductase [Clostridiales bacterium]
MSFKDKVILITGTSSGIGKLCGERFLELGAIVIGTIRRDQPSFTEMADLYPDRCFTKKLEVADRMQVEKVVAEIIAEHGHIDILINNAGTHMNATVVETSEDEWDNVINSNVKSVYLLCHNVIPIMQKQKSGNIINVSSRVGVTGSPRSAAYCASKAAVNNLTREMAIDYAVDNIRINAVAPGMVETPMVDRQFGNDEDRKEKTIQMYPMKRFSKPEEIVDVIEFLASDKSSNLTGTIIAVDGGRSAM